MESSTIKFLQDEYKTNLKRYFEIKQDIELGIIKGQEFIDLINELTEIIHDQQQIDGILARKRKINTIQNHEKT